MTKENTKTISTVILEEFIVISTKISIVNVKEYKI